MSDDDRALSDRAAAGMTAGSMAAANTISDESAAMTAPGSESELVRDEKPDSSVMDLTPDSAVDRHLVHGEEGGSPGWSWDDVSGRREPWGP